MNRLLIVVGASGLLAALAATSSHAELAPAISKPVLAAVADAARPEVDRARDADRKPAETLAFAGIKPGDVVADYAAGAGYFTRLFADVVQSTGHVYAMVPSELFQYPNVVKGIADIETFAVGHPNVTVTFAAAMAALKFPERLDLFWISQHHQRVRRVGPWSHRSVHSQVPEAEVAAASSSGASS